MERDGKGKFSQWVGGLKQPLEQQIEDKRNGIGRQKRPYVGEWQKAVPGLRKSVTNLSTRIVYALTVAMLGVMIYELVYNGREQGNPFSFRVRAC